MIEHAVAAAYLKINQLTANQKLTATSGTVQDVARGERTRRYYSRWACATQHRLRARPTLVALYVAAQASTRRAYPPSYDALRPAPSGRGAIGLSARDTFEDLLLYVGGRLRVALSNEQLGEVMPAHDGVGVPFSHRLVV